jgi:fructokinase
MAFELDVNAAAYGEYRYGNARGIENFIYLTIGTGIGGGVMVDGKLLHGLVHPEMGHIRIPHDLERDPFPGVCSYHGDCLEGLATGPSMEKRWGQPAESLSVDHPAWSLEAHYIALGVSSFICTLSPQRIIIGGGVMSAPNLLSMVQKEVMTILNGYVQAPEIIEDIEDYIVLPQLGPDAGIVGALAMAEALVEND